MTAKQALCVWPRIALSPRGPPGRMPKDGGGGGCKREAHVLMVSPDLFSTLDAQELEFLFL